jgi:phenylacetic acid degradation operon negative regulatory protein
LFTVLGEFVLPRGGDAWTAALVRALGALGVEDKAARQSLARTASDGWLARERHGRRVMWRLTDAGRSLLAEGAERIYSFGGAQEDWDGRWVLLFVDPAKLERDERHRLSTSLAWAGYGLLRPGMWIAAHVEREAEARAVLDGLGLIADGVSFIARSGTVGDEAALVARAWDLESLEDRYEEFIETFEPARPKHPRGTFVALAGLVHEWRKFPFLDPGLPSRLLPSRWSGDRAQRLFRQRRAAWEAPARRWFESE